MNIYFKLLKSPIFSIEDVNIYYNNIESSRSAVKRMIKNGLVVKIRNNMYTCISGETGAPIANRFQIASKITDCSYVSHHTAMEYYGITNQVYYDVYVSSDKRFQPFSFDGYTYVCVRSNGNVGVLSPKFSGGITITDIERTILDSIKDMDRIAGIEEVIQNIESINQLQESKLLKYLEEFDNQFLYQKVGYLLSNYGDALSLSNEFFCKCKKKIGKSKRYLTKDIIKGQYNNEWRLVVPKDMDNTRNGVDIYATI